MKRCLTKKQRSLLKDDVASTASAFALALPAILGVVGIAVDFGMLHAKRVKLQQAADSAAIAAAKELSVATSSDKTILSVARTYAKSNVSGTSEDLTISATVGKQRDEVTVSLAESWTPFFAHFLQAGVTPIVVEAKAKLAGEANICVLALDPSEAKSLHMDHNGQILGKGCAVYANSGSQEGIRLDAAAMLSADLVCAAGGVYANAGAIAQQVNEDCPPIPDPLASRAAPKVAGCDHSNLDIDSGTVTLMPGTYCQGLKIAGNAKVTFATGDYIITGGKFEISGSSTVKGENVAFYLDGDAAVLQFTEDTTLELSGAKSGPMAGLLFFEDRKASLDRLHRINSIKAIELTGTIYMPRGQLRIDPNSTVAASSDYTALIVNKLQVYEGSKLILNSDYKKSNVPVPEGILMRDQVVLTR